MKPRSGPVVPGFQTTAELVEGAARAAPDRAALVATDGQQLSYRELVLSSRRLGRLLLARGLQPGDRVATWMSDSVEYVQSYVACALAGLVVVPINARYTEHEARHLIVDSGARILLHNIQGTADRAGRIDLLEHGVQLLDVETDPDVREALVGRNGADLPGDRLASPKPESPLVIGYTSGTTGTPKGAILTQRSVATLARMNASAYRLPIGSIAAMTGSMSFVAVVPAHIMSHFYVGGTVCLLGEWTVSSLLEAIEKYRATFTYIPSPLIDEFCELAARDPRAWASLVTVLHSASRAAPEKLERLSAVVGARFVEGWGMTENSGGLITATTPADAAPGSGRLGTVGRAVPEVEIALVDADGLLLPHDGSTSGELICRSPALMSGYWGMPEESARVLADGWYRTGDLGTIDADGYVTLTERRVDLIVSGGMNVYPSEVEHCLASHPAVAASCVVGVPHRRWGQSVAAAVVRRRGARVTEDELVDHCRTYLASYKKPTRVVFVDALPTTTSLKTSRQAVRKMLT
jgi:fatty-acyl-CoA synthase